MEFNLSDILVNQELEFTALIRSVELQLAKAPIELGFAFNSEGRVVARAMGTANSIRFSQQQISAMHGHTLTHNHPSHGFFSIFDIQFAALADLAAIRAVAGRKVYVLTRPASGWSTEVFDRKVESEKRKILRNLAQNQISRAEASKRANNLVRTVVKLLALPLSEEKL